MSQMYMSTPWVFPFTIFITIIVALLYIVRLLREMNTDEYKVDLVQISGWYTAFLYWCLTSIEPGFVPLRSRTSSTSLSANHSSALAGLSLRIPQDYDAELEPLGASMNTPQDPRADNGDEYGSGRNVFTPMTSPNTSPTYCNICSQNRPPRAHHCRDCGRCVDVRDHHCAWLGTCIGKDNYRIFFQFTLLCLAHSLLLLLLTLYYYFIYGYAASKRILDDDSLPHARRLELVRKMNSLRLPIWHLWPTFIIASLGTYFAANMLGRICRSLVHNVTWLEEHRQLLQKQKQIQIELQQKQYQAEQPSLLSCPSPSNDYLTSAIPQTQQYDDPRGHESFLAERKISLERSPSSSPRADTALTPTFGSSMLKLSPMDSESVASSSSTDSSTDSVKTQILTSKNIQNSSSNGTQVSLIPSPRRSNSPLSQDYSSDDNDSCLGFLQQAGRVICPPPTSIVESVTNSRLLLGLPTRGVSVPRMVVETPIILVLPPFSLLFNNLKSTIAESQQNGRITRNLLKLPCACATYFKRAGLGKKLFSTNASSSHDRRKSGLPTQNYEYDRYDSKNNQQSFDEL